MELHDAEEAIGMRKILAHDMRIKTLSGFDGLLWSYAGPKSNLPPPPPHPRKKTSSISVTNFEIIFKLLLFQTLCIDWLKKKRLLWLKKI